MKILITLSVLQFLLLAILTSRLLDLEAALSAQADPVASHPHRASSSAGAARDGARVDGTDASVTAEELRAIVREELAQQSSAISEPGDDRRSKIASRST